MAKRTRKKTSPVEQLHEIAMAFPEAEERTSCNKTAYKGRKKSFLFVGQKDDSYNVMVKLDDSLDEAATLESKAPENFSVGAHGWTTLNFPLNEQPETGLFERWIEESFRLIVPKTLVKILDENAS